MLMGTSFHMYVGCGVALCFRLRAKPAWWVPQRNIKPRTRAQRRQMADKETLEKSRLREVWCCAVYAFLVRSRRMWRMASHACSW